MKIIGTGSAIPKKIVTNSDLEKLVETSDEWIRTRTGIEERRVAVEETSTSLSVEAARKALEAANVQPEELDMIIAATLSADHLVPMLSCEVQAALGASHAVAFDLNAACTGFLFALGTANAYMSTGQYHKILIIGCEVLSKITDWSDRATCVLFGDGAGAAVLSDEEDGLLGLVQGTDGSRGMALLCDHRKVCNPFAETKVQKDIGYVFMDGQAVYRFAVKTVPAAIEEVLERAGLGLEDISLFVLHQANLRIINAVAKRLHQPIEKFPHCLNEYGNTSASSIPILLDREVRAGHIKKGDKILLSGFGGGLTWGACVLEW